MEEEIFELNVLIENTERLLRKYEKDIHYYKMFVQTYSTNKKRVDPVNSLLVELKVIAIELEKQLILLKKLKKGVLEKMRFAYQIKCFDESRIIGSIEADGIDEAVDLIAEEIEKDLENDRMTYEDIVKNMIINRIKEKT